MNFQTTFKDIPTENISFEQSSLYSNVIVDGIIAYFDSYKQTTENINEDNQKFQAKIRKAWGDQNCGNHVKKSNLAMGENKCAISTKNRKKAILVDQTAIKIDAWQVQKVLTEKCTNTSNIIKYTSKNMANNQKATTRFKENSNNPQSVKAQKNVVNYDSAQTYNKSKKSFKHRKYMKSAKFTQGIFSIVDCDQFQESSIQNSQQENKIKQNENVLTKQKLYCKKSESLNQISPYASSKYYSLKKNIKNDNQADNGNSNNNYNSISTFQILKKEKQHLQTESIIRKFPTTKMISSQLNLLQMQKVQQNGNRQLNFIRFIENEQRQSKISSRQQKKVSRIGIRRAKSIVVQNQQKGRQSKLFLQGLSKEKTIKKQALQVRPLSGTTQQLAFENHSAKLQFTNSSSNIFANMSNIIAEKYYSRNKVNSFIQTQSNFSRDRFDEKFAIHTKKTKLPFKNIFQRKRNQKLSLSNTLKQSSSFAKKPQRFQICQLKGCRIQKMLSTLERSNLQETLKNKQNGRVRVKTTQSYMVNELL